MIISEYFLCGPEFFIREFLPPFSTWVKLELQLLLIFLLWLRTSFSFVAKHRSVVWSLMNMSSPNTCVAPSIAVLFPLWPSPAQTQRFHFCVHGGALWCYAKTLSAMHKQGKRRSRISRADISFVSIHIEIKPIQE